MNSPLLILCRIGWHRPVPRGTWNQGYCFTTCSRCGRDMVRSLFGEWHVPANFRVVWSPREGGSEDRKADEIEQPIIELTAKLSDLSPFNFADFEPPKIKGEFAAGANRRRA